MILRADKLREPRFSQAQCDAFFAAVLINDERDAQTKLPEAVQLDYSQDQLADCFYLCHQLWKQSAPKETLIELTKKLVRNHDLSAEDRTQFKYIRAKFKQLRYAHALYGKPHRYPYFMNRITIALGQMQDAYKNKRLGATLFRAAIIRFLLTAPMQYLLAREINQLDLVSPAEFRLYLESQIAIVRSVLQQEAVTGEQFHATRKIIGRQVSFFDTLRTIHPSPDAFLMSRALAAINGLMGAMHDEMIERQIKGRPEYHTEKFKLPDEIASRLKALVARYPQ